MGTRRDVASRRSAPSGHVATTTLQRGPFSRCQKVPFLLAISRANDPSGLRGGRRGGAATCDQRPVLNRPGSTPRDGTLAVSDGGGAASRRAISALKSPSRAWRGFRLDTVGALPKTILLTRPFGQTAHSVTEPLELASIIHCVTGRLWTRHASGRMTWP